MNTDNLTFHLVFSCGCCSTRPFFNFWPLLAPEVGSRYWGIMKCTRRAQKFVFTAAQQALAFQKGRSVKGCLLFYLPGANTAVQSCELYSQGWHKQWSRSALGVVIVITSTNTIRYLGYLNPSHVNLDCHLPTNSTLCVPWVPVHHIDLCFNKDGSKKLPPAIFARFLKVCF